MWKWQRGETEDLVQSLIHFPIFYTHASISRYSFRMSLCNRFSDSLSPSLYDGCFSARIVIGLAGMPLRFSPNGSVALKPQVPPSSHTPSWPPFRPHFRTPPTPHPPCKYISPCRLLSKYRSSFPSIAAPSQTHKHDSLPPVSFTPSSGQTHTDTLLQDSLQRGSHFLLLPDMTCRYDDLM